MFDGLLKSPTGFFLGRISFDTQSHLTTQISKLLNYESSPYMGENWFTRACLAGDPSTSGISCVITNEHIHEILDLVGFNDVNTIYSGSFPNQMTSGITEGISFFNYRDIQQHILDNLLW